MGLRAGVGLTVQMQGYETQYEKTESAKMLNKQYGKLQWD